MRAQNRALHCNPKYGAGGGKWAGTVKDVMAQFGCHSVLDYGCGKGGLKRALPGLDIREYDPAIPGKDKLPEPADLVLCSDVLEHVEPEFLESVLTHIRDLARRAVVLSPSVREASKSLPDGRNAHLIVQPPQWWRDRFVQYFDFVQDTTRGNYTFLGTTKET